MHRITTIGQSALNATKKLLTRKLCIAQMPVEAIVVFSVVCVLFLVFTDASATSLAQTFVIQRRRSVGSGTIFASVRRHRNAVGAPSANINAPGADRAWLTVLAMEPALTQVAHLTARANATMGGEEIIVPSQ